MGIVYQYTEKTNIIHTKVTGVINVDEMLEYVSNIIGDPQIKNGFIEIVDLEEVIDIIVSYSDLRPFAETWQRYLKKGCRATLFFAPTEIGFGTARMLMAMIKTQNSADNNRFKLFRSKEKLSAALKNFGV